MKSLNQKWLLVIMVFLIVLCFIFIVQWNKEKNQSNYLKSVKEQMVFKNFTYLSKELYDVSETLRKYDTGFTDQEMVLFSQLLDKDIRSLKETGMNLSYLMHPTSLDGMLIYENYIWKIEQKLRKIKEGEISNEYIIHSIGNVIKNQDEQLTDLFFGEQQVGVEGINTNEEVTKVLEIIDIMNEEVEDILHK